MSRIRSLGLLAALALWFPAATEGQQARTRVGGYLGLDAREQRPLAGFRVVHSFRHRGGVLDRSTTDVGLGSVPTSLFFYQELQGALRHLDEEPWLLPGLGVGLQIADNRDHSGFLVGASATVEPGDQDVLSLTTRVALGPGSAELTAQFLLSLTVSRRPGIQLPRPPEFDAPFRGP